MFIYFSIWPLRDVLLVSKKIDMKIFFALLMSTIFILGCENESEEGEKVVMVGNGEMPNLTKDKEGRIHVVYGQGDQIMHTMSGDQGRSYPVPDVVNKLPELAASHMRGPQIAATSNGLLVTACTHDGDIYSFIKDSSGNWTKSGRINDMDTVAKENLMALAADSLFAYAIWLDLRDGHNKIFGAASMDGGKTWGKNALVYASPDATVCECCKPSVMVKGNKVVVMFRNWLNGNRDMYVIESMDNGKTFGEAMKLGTGSWALDGCPMDGGGLVLNDANGLNAVWRREKKIYVGNTNKEETVIGEGRGCTIESANGKNIFAWVDDGEIVILKPGGIKETIGDGSMPVLKAMDDHHVLCVWQNEKEIYSKIIEL